MQKLSIIIPVYNEAATVIKVFEKIRSVELIHGIQKQLVVVNDASTDNSAGLITAYMQAHPEVEMSLTTHEKNAGKGAAIHTGIEKASGDFIIIQDADLEYDPNDYNRLLQPIMDDAADIVYGSRFVGGHPHRILFFWHSIGNKMLTFFSNMLTNLNLTDMEIGYKLFRAEIIKSIPLEEKRFGFEPEITAKIARLPGVRIYEVGISYYGRTYQEGKKINWKDGVRAFYSIIKYNAFVKRKQPPPVRSADSLLYLVTAIFFLAGIILMFTANGTGDEGDSVMHYLYARHAYDYPEFFFYHWAKPVYQLVAAPFAQLGFNGIRLFNLLVSCGTLLLTFRMAKKIGMPNAWLAPFCTAMAPLMMIVTFSGLTEPLFALWMMIGFTWLTDKKYFAGFLWISFLPFVRSEGLVIICVLAVYAFFTKAVKYLPLLAAGHLAYALAGYFFMNKDPLWIFKDISYATLDGVYGNGTWNEYILRWPEVSGVILTFFLAFGLIYGAIRTAGRFVFFQRHAISNTELFLVYGTFVAYVVAHAIFWALGIFNSAGLIRVMMPVLPLAGIICARGINFITIPVDVIIKSKKFLWASVILIIIYPFVPHHYRINYKQNYALKADQLAELRLASYMKKNFPDYKNYMAFFEASYISVALDINYFDTTKHRRLYKSFEENNFPPGSFIIWDDWFARTHDVPYERIEQDGRFQWLGTFTEKDVWGVKRVAKLYRKKD